MISYQFYDFCPSGSDFDCIEGQSCYKVNKCTPINCETTKSGQSYYKVNKCMLINCKITKSGKCKQCKESKSGTIKKDKSGKSKRKSEKDEKESKKGKDTKSIRQLNYDIYGKGELKGFNDSRKNQKVCLYI